ncbi:MAG: hypothetical protein IJE89_03160 [Bacilli bacterium]|nr:hypothetical protein [Bacilli bacterium]
MMESSESKKKMFYMIVLVLTLITMIIGATLAYFSLVASQKEEGTVLYTGKLEITYIDGVYIRNPVLYPVNNPSYNTYQDVYRNTFSVASSGTLDQMISIELEVTNNEFNDGSIRYIIYNDKGIEIARGNVPQEEGKVILASNMFLEAVATAKYTLIIWLDNKNYNQNAEMGKTITGKLNIHSKQIRY